MWLIQGLRLLSFALQRITLSTRVSVKIEMKLQYISMEYTDLPLLFR